MCASAAPRQRRAGFGVAEFRAVGAMIAEVLDGLAAGGDGNAAVEGAVRHKVSALCAHFPIYPG